MVLLPSKQIPMGTVLPTWKALPATDGGAYGSLDFLDKPLVLIVMCFHCPYVQAILPDLNELLNKFFDQCSFVGVNPNDQERYPDASLASMSEHAAREGLEQMVFLRDDEQTLVKDLEASCTPDIYLYDGQQELAYHGRIEELGLAIETLLSGQNYAKQQIPSQGCSVKWLQK